MKLNTLITAKSLILVCTFQVAKSGLAEQATSRNTSPPNGKGKIVGGVMTTVIGAAAGLTITFAGMIKSVCSDSEYDSSKEIDKCVKESEQMVLGGLLVAGVSVGVGVPLIIMGKRERNAWQRSNEGGDTSGRHPLYSIGVVTTVAIF